MPTLKDMVRNLSLASIFAVSCSASVITSTASATVTATQSGDYHVNDYIFSIDAGWDSFGPQDQFGYSQVIWQVDIPGVNIPQGSTVNRATLDWFDYQTHDENIRVRNLKCFLVPCLSGSLNVYGGSQTFVNWVESGGTYYWLPKSDYNRSGTFDLVALGFGAAIPNGDAVSFNGGHQVSLGSAQVDLVDDFYGSLTTFGVIYNNHMTMTGTLTLDYTAPPPPSVTPEPTTMSMVAISLVAVALKKVRLRHSASA